MNIALPRVDSARLPRRLLLGLLCALSSGCVRSGHSDHYLWFEVQQRSPTATSTLSVHANRSAFLTTYGSVRPDSSREVGPSFDDELSELQMQQLSALFDPARTKAYRADSTSEERFRAAESALLVSVDAQVANAPTSESLVLRFVSGDEFRPETRALLDYLGELQQGVYDRGVQPPHSAARTPWARPATFQ